jgi:hypothetical protein
MDYDPLEAELNSTRTFCSLLWQPAWAESDSAALSYIYRRGCGNLKQCCSSGAFTVPSDFYNRPAAPELYGATRDIVVPHSDRITARRG